jgi:SagB-type dehydrogenase family enzyme
VRSRALRYRRASSLVSYWDEGELIFENYATSACISVDPLATEILHIFDRWQSPDALARRLPDYTPESLRRAVGVLHRHGLLERSDRPSDARTRAMGGWASWNPAAGFFHSTTKDVQFDDRAAVIRAVRRKAKRVGLPARFKRYKNARMLPLPRPRFVGPFPEILLARRTWRRFSRRKVSRDDLSMLLGLTWGVHDWIDVPGVGRLPLKTSPSGGARHPIEVYVLARRIDGVPPGLYHYVPDRHALELVRTGASSQQILSYLPTQTYYGAAAALMLMTAVFERTQWKYEFARAYRVVLAEAGHLCQTFCLTATWLGLAPFCTMALADSRIERDLEIDGVSESVLYAAGVGARPRGIEPPVVDGGGPARRLSRAEVDRFPGRILPSR